MPMPPYPIYCQAPRCNEFAAYKIAGRWSDGLVQELKTYALVCDRCLPAAFAACLEKRARCRLTANETLGDPLIFDLRPCTPSQFLIRRKDLEEKLATS